MKQIGLALVTYANDYDETYPRADFDTGQCPLPGAPATAVGANCSRVNHYHWWVWLFPYTKTSEVFFCPSRMPDPKAGRDEFNKDAWQEWYVSSEIYNGFLLNLSLTGALNTWGRDPNNLPLGAIRNSFSGGTMFGVRRPSETMIVMEGRGYLIPTLDVWSAVEYDCWPAAYRNYWRQVFYSSQNFEINSKTPYPVPSDWEINNSAMPHSNGMNVSYCDGHVKWLNHQQFMGLCPDKAGGDPGFEAEKYLPNSTVPQPTGANSDAGIGLKVDAQSTLLRDYPFWNLYKPGSGS